VPRRDGAFALIAREDNSYFDCDDDGSCGTDGGGAESVEGCDNSDGGGGGKTEEIGGSGAPLAQLSEHTLNPIRQHCMH
jgi:hypothetical protein